MAISIDWFRKVIFIPKADLTLIDPGPPEIRQLDLNDFRLDLKDLEDDAAGIPNLTTHNHSATITVGGVTLARVVEIINGYVVEFEDGQYAVNLVGANSNVSEKVIVNQVSIRSANSAGLTYSDQINQQSFVNAQVWVDATNGTAGTRFPFGTPPARVLGCADALTIAARVSLTKFHLIGSLVCTSANDLTGTVWAGDNPLASSLALGGATTTNALFRNLTVSGQNTGRCSMLDCIVSNVTDFNGLLENCEVVGNLTLVAFSTLTQSLKTCYHRDPQSPPTINVNGATGAVHIHHYSGGLTLTGVTGSNVVFVSLVAGQLTIDASCTAGTVVVSGTGVLIDNSAVGCTVIQDSFLEPRGKA